MDIKRIDERFSVSPQVLPADIGAIRAAGFTTIINNRPDGEAPDQPTGAAIAAAANAAGLTYISIPVGREGVSPALVEQTRQAIAARPGPILAFCRSGTRSTTLWALSQAGSRDADTIIAAANRAGYDIRHLAGHL